MLNLKELNPSNYLGLDLFIKIYLHVTRLFCKIACQRKAHMHKHVLEEQGISIRSEYIATAKLSEFYVRYIEYYFEFE